MILNEFMSCQDLSKFVSSIPQNCCTNSNIDIKCENNLITELTLSGISFSAPANFLPFAAKLRKLDLNYVDLGNPTDLDSVIKRLKIDSLTRLEELTIINCKLTGSLSCDIKQLDLLDLSNNLLTGPVPTCFRQPTTLILNGNQIVGSTSTISKNNNETILSTQGSSAIISVATVTPLPRTVSISSPTVALVQQTEAPLAIQSRFPDKSERSERVIPTTLPTTTTQHSDTLQPVARIQHLSHGNSATSTPSLTSKPYEESLTSLNLISNPLFIGGMLAAGILLVGCIIVIVIRKKTKENEKICDQIDNTLSFCSPDRYSALSIPEGERLGNLSTRSYSANKDSSPDFEYQRGESIISDSTRDFSVQSHQYSDSTARYSETSNLSSINTEMTDKYTLAYGGLLRCTVDERNSDMTEFSSIASSYDLKYRSTQILSDYTDEYRLSAKLSKSSNRSSYHTASVMSEWSSVDYNEDYNA